MPASIRIGDGFARLGGVTLPARASARGLEVGSEAVLCPLSFGLRGRLVAWSGENLSRALLAETLSGDAEGLDPLALQVLALHLAGANSGAPGFSASAALVARLLGWPLADINAAEALEIDRLAASLAPSMEQAGDEGWTTVVFAPDEGDDGEGEPLEALCVRLVEDLRRRADAAISLGEMTILRAAPPAFRAFGDRQAVAGGAPAALDMASQAPTVQGEPSDRDGTAPADDLREPPANPWIGKPPTAVPAGFDAATASHAPAEETLAQPLSGRGPDASVWAVPEVDGDPAFGDQAGPADDSGGSGQVSADTTLASPEQAFAPALSPLSGTAQRAVPVSDTLPHTLVSAARPRALRATPGAHTNPVAPFGQARAAHEASVFWPAATPGPASGEALVQPFAAAMLDLPAAATPDVPAATEPTTDLDAIADALHAIADLRGVAR